MPNEFSADNVFEGERFLGDWVLNPEFTPTEDEVVRTILAVQQSPYEFPFSPEDAKRIAEVLHGMDDLRIAVAHLFMENPPGFGEDYEMS
jgi:hypothetical protein